MSKTITKQSFNKETLTRTKVTNNIIRCYNQTTEEDRHDWYQEAYEYCEELAKKNSLSTMQVAGVVSAVSPMKSWDQNKKLAKEIIEEGKRSGTFSACIKKAESIIDLDPNNINSLEIERILNGNKIKSFFQNIYFVKDHKRVTVDRHAIEIAVNKTLTDKEKTLSDSQYKFFHHCYDRAAKKLKIRPSLLQSSTWVYWRKVRKSK